MPLYRPVHQTFARRSFLFGGLTFLGASGTTLAGEAPRGVVQRPPPPASLSQHRRLRELARSRGLIFGVATGAQLISDSRFSAALIREADLVVPENAGKWSSLAKQEGLDFQELDALASFSIDNGLTFHGHVLVWHRALPEHVSKRIARGEGRLLLGEHTSSVLSRFRDRAISWDVVNEAVEPMDGRPDGLRRTVWSTALGPDYLKFAFEAARKVAPNLALYYNDYGTEYATPQHEARREAISRVLSELVREGLVDGFGMQSHLFVGVPFSAERLRRFIREIAALGLEIRLSELDVNDQAIAGSDEERDRAIALHSREFFDAALADSSLRAIVTWGLSTRYSWLNTTPEIKRFDGRTTRGLPFDDNLVRTPMGDALAHALLSASGSTPGPKLDNSNFRATC